MSAKLDKYAEERDKARKKRDEWDARMKMWDEKFRELENEEIHDLVHAYKLSPEQLAEVLKSVNHEAPDMTKLPEQEVEECDSEN